MLDEIMKSTKESLAERLSSPILGSFLLSWCLWNYKFLVILFSSTGVSTTFKLVELHAFPDTTALLVRGIFLPALTAAAYIFIYPYPAKFVYGFSRRRQREINELKRQIENETPLTLEESRTIRAESFQSEKKSQEAIDRLSAEITRLNADLEAARVTNSNVPESPPSKTAPKTALSPTEEGLLQIVEGAGGIATQSHLIAKSAESKVKVLFDIGELEQRKLLHKNYDQNKREYTYEFTHEGRRAFLKLKQQDA